MFTNVYSAIRSLYMYRIIYIYIIIFIYIYRERELYIYIYIYIRMPLSKAYILSSKKAPFFLFFFFFFVFWSHLVIESPCQFLKCCCNEVEFISKTNILRRKLQVPSDINACSFLPTLNLVQKNALYILNYHE